MQKMEVKRDNLFPLRFPCGRKRIEPSAVLGRSHQPSPQQATPRCIKSAFLQSFHNHFSMNYQRRKASRILHPSLVWQMNFLMSWLGRAAVQLLPWFCQSLATRGNWFTSSLRRSMVIRDQLSVENAMASKATETTAAMVARESV